MSGIYGNDQEDKYFENKLLNETQNEEESYDDNLPFTEIDQDLVDVVTELTNDRDFTEDLFQIMDDLIIPVLQKLSDSDIINPQHLKQHLEELRLSNKKMGEIREYQEEIEYNIKKIAELAKEL